MSATMPVTLVPALGAAMPTATMTTQQTFEKAHVDHS